MKLKLKRTTANSNHEHALLSPSAARKWLGCPAALACEFGIPNESGAAAVNGTAMHHISEVILGQLIKGGKASAKPYKASHVLNNGKGPIKALASPEKGAVLITDDFVSQVAKYVDYCRPIIDAAELVEVESRVNLTRILHPGVEIDGKPLATFGTADLVALIPIPVTIKPAESDYMLMVGDLKTGRHRVSAKENKQMMLYALGLLRVYKRLYDITAVRLVIFQPYAGGADEWDVTPEALEQFGKFAQTRALKAIDAFQRGKKGLKPADFRPSADSCQWCRFSEKCQAKRRMAGGSLHDRADDSPNEMTTEQIKAEYDKLPLMRQHIADIEKAMYAALMRGEQVEGLKLVEGRPGNRSWSDVKAVEDKFGSFKQLYKETLLTPTEAENNLKGTELLEELSEYIARKPGQPSITTADDKRPAWAPVSDDDLSN
ncbi:ATP-dependent helicase/nuclease [Pantoea phage AH01]|nr:ATP-dependent helicase/nuclease [Pantoea phage AH01]